MAIVIAAELTDGRSSGDNWRTWGAPPPPVRWSLEIGEVSVIEMISMKLDARLGWWVEGWRRSVKDKKKTRRK
jgi:hypothetical protein